MKNLVLITEVGISLVVPIILGVYFGQFLDSWLNTKWIFSIVMILLGIASGFYKTYDLIMRFNPEGKGKKSEDK